MAVSVDLEPEENRLLVKKSIDTLLRQRNILENPCIGGAVGHGTFRRNQRPPQRGWLMFN